MPLDLLDIIQWVSNGNVQLINGVLGTRLIARFTLFRGVLWGSSEGPIEVVEVRLNEARPYQFRFPCGWLQKISENVPLKTLLVAPATRPVREEANYHLVPSSGYARSSEIDPPPERMIVISIQISIVGKLSGSSRSKVGCTPELLVEH